MLEKTQILTVIIRIDLSGENGKENWVKGNSRRKIQWKKNSQESFNMYEGQFWQPHDFQDWQENSKHYTNFTPEQILPFWILALNHLKSICYMLLIAMKLHMLFFSNFINTPWGSIINYVTNYTCHGHLQTLNWNTKLMLYKFILKLTSFSLLWLKISCSFTCQFTNLKGIS